MKLLNVSSIKSRHTYFFTYILTICIGRFIKLLNFSNIKSTHLSILDCFWGYKNYWIFYRYLLGCPVSSMTRPNNVIKVIHQRILLWMSIVMLTQVLFGESIVVACRSIRRIVGDLRQWHASGRQMGRLQQLCVADMFVSTDLCLQQMLDPGDTERWTWPSFITCRISLIQCELV